MEVNGELLQKYYQSECTPEEKAAVEAWQTSMDAGDPEPLEETERLALETEMWTHLQQNMPVPFKTIVEVQQQRPLFKRLQRFGSVAAILLIVCAAVFFVFRKVPVTSQPIAYQTLSTRGAEKKEIQMEDGTKIILNSSTTLRYPAHFTDTSRIVYLTGEAYFHVAKDHTRPFSILTAGTRTQVLGTVFNLKAYPGEATSLKVEEGKVRFGGLDIRQPRQLFTRGQYGIFNEKQELSKTTGNSLMVAPWKENRLVFENESLAAITATLERWYNISIKITGQQLSQQQFTGTFDNPPVTFLLDRLSFVMKFKYVINGNTVQIRSNP